ncbi:uncharacterized protein LOC124541014 [Vanessa cardui]|uniref:uncharacterized protein LOC124541014 n=1 Tax=Vanessa cardui TaxID=171605 RepID=UPI001F134085|nr:uncharacterized protein LOC124541014 [Vanessa cardui]
MTSVQLSYNYLLDNGSYVEEDVVEEFNSLLRVVHGYQNRSVYEITTERLRQKALPVDPNSNFLQVLFRPDSDDFSKVGHWVCVYYSSHTLKVYDSLYKNLSEIQAEYLRKLFPYILENEIIFPVVQKQPNLIDCGLYAIAFSTSIVLGLDPCNIKFNVEFLRSHTLNILLTHRLTEFPSTVINRGGRPQNKYCGTKLERKRIGERNKKRRQKINKLSNCSQIEVLGKTVLSITIPVSYETLENPNCSYDQNAPINSNFSPVKSTSLIACKRKSSRILENNLKRERLSRCSDDTKNRKKERDKESKKLQRSVPRRRKTEQKRNTVSRRISRQDRTYRERERVLNTASHHILRQDPAYKTLEQERDTIAHRLSRKNPEYATRETEIRNIRNQNIENDWDKIEKQFFDSILHGHTSICSCCGRLWHRNSLKSLKVNHLSFFLDEVMRNIKLSTFSDNNNYMFCYTCHNNLKAGKIPRLAMSNGLLFPDIPDVLQKLTPLEERLVSPRHIFLKIVRKGQGLGYQHGLTGGVVNVPVDVNTMISALPRHPSDNHIITIELKRRMCYKHGRKERIRPDVIREAAKYLVQTDLFKKIGIKYDEEWIYDDQSDDENCLEKCTCDVLAQEEKNINPGNVETLLDNEKDVTITMAPGEGNQPRSLIYDEYMEELGFIKIHGGVERKFKINLSNSEIMKSEITRFDRRAMRADYLFTLLKKQQMLQLRNNILTCLRKKVNNSVPIIVSNLLKDEYLNNLIQHDDGYRVLCDVRNSPAHWENEKKKVLAMVRQFGVPTLFVTVSAAEAKWPELIKQLKKTVDKGEVSLKEARSISYEEKARLIQSDPFICVTFFETRLKELMKTWLVPSGPFGDNKISHQYHRIEFQHRGSPHAHIMLWIEGAPIYTPEDETSIENIIKFVDMIVSCDSNEISNDLVAIQTHKHTHTCHPKPDRPCRFGIPFFPMDKTRLLTELYKDDPSTAKWKKNSKKLKEDLSNVSNDITFDDYLKSTGLTISEYILAVRATLKRPKIFLKRKPKDILLNPFCKKILELQQANMDCQFILDPFACSVYIVDYINKTDRGMSNLLRAAVEEAKNGNANIKESLRAISKVFLNSSEISAQEAIYCLAGLPLSRASEADIYINTGHPNERVGILKPMETLKSLNASSTDIFQKNLLDHYINRPQDDYFERMSLAYFAAYYTYSTKLSKSYENENMEENTEDRTTGSWIQLLNNDGYIRRRLKPKIIRFRRYNREQDPDNFYREQIMLYVPWRNEESELVNDELNLEEIFLNKCNMIKSESIQFNSLGGPEEFEALLAAVRNAENDDEENDNNRAEARACALGEYELETQEIDPDHCLQLQGEQGNDLICRVIAQPLLMNEDHVLALLRMLNSDQRNFVLHLGNLFTQQLELPFYYFVSGGAGVGKSLLIKALYQYLMLIFNREPGTNPDEIKILLCAFTGKAAFGIGGQTVHNAFCLPISQCGSTMPSLSAGTANTLASKLCKVKLIILDEISMLGSRTFNQINRRLQQIFHTDVPFAGKSIISVGDFNQLPPVGDNWIFQPNTGRNPMAVLAGAPLWEPFRLFPMTKIMRQRDDLNFAIALNNMATGNMNHIDIQLIKSRCFKMSSLPADADGAIHLFASNKEVDNYNKQKLSLMNTEGCSVKAIDIVSGSPNPIAKKKALQSVNALPTMKTYGLPKILYVKISARYMITVNLDTSDGLVNGTTGLLKAIEYGRHITTNERRPLRLWLQFDNNVGIATRNKFEVHTRNHHAYIESQWTPLETSTYTVKQWKSSNLKVHRSQFPVVPAEGMTIHKSQGCTMEKIVVHLSRNVKRSMLYVACSRATSASGLYLVTSDGNFNPPAKVSEKSAVHLEMMRLLENKLIPQFEVLQSPGDEIQIIFHNVQSLRKHLLDVKADCIIHSSHITLFVETWGSRSDNFELEGFEQVCRIDGPNVLNANPGRGAIAYINCNYVNELDDGSNKGLFIDSPGGGHCECLQFKAFGVQFLTVYKSPRCLPKIAVECIKKAISANEKIIIAGDFNIDFKDKSKNEISEYLLSLGLTPRIQEYTTRQNSTIDNIFSNIPLQSGTIHTFFSYHKQIWVRFKKNI